MKTNQRLTSLFLFILFIFFTSLVIFAFYLRFFNLPLQGFLFYDEAAFYYRATQFKSIIALGKAIHLDSFYPDTKILWMGLLTGVRIFWLDAPVMGNYLAAFFGVLGVVLSFNLAQKLFQSYVISALTAFILCFMPLHIFYSRVGLPETLSMDFILLCLLSALKEKERKDKISFLSSLWAAMGFLANRFRVSMVIFYYMFLPGESEKCSIRRRAIQNVGFIIFSIFFVFIGIKLFETIFLLNGVVTPRYGETLGRHVALHHFVLPSGQDVAFLFYYLSLVHGPVGMALLLLSVLWAVKNPVSRYLLFCVGLQMAVMLCVDEQVLRSLSITLPFQAMLCAFSIYSLSNLFKNSYLRVSVFLTAVGMLLVSWANPLVDLYNFKNAMPEAISYVKSQKEDTGIITTNLMQSLPYMLPQRVYGLNKVDSVKSLPALSQNGYDYIITDSMKYDPSIGEGYQLIEQYCKPEIQYMSASPAWQKWAVLESKLSTKEKIETSSQAAFEKGIIRVYKTRDCIHLLP